MTLLARDFGEAETHPERLSDPVICAEDNRGKTDNFNVDMGVLSIALVFTIGLVSYPSEVSAAWGFSSSGSDPGKVLLRDVQVNKK